MTNGVVVSNGRVLHSWKEIASYMGRGVRTVQRYECKLGFPVRRPAGTPRSAVMAFTHEIDAWLAHSPTRVDLQTPEPASVHSSPVILHEIRSAAKNDQRLVIDTLYQKAKLQRDCAIAMQQRMRETQELVIRMKDFMERRKAVKSQNSVNPPRIETQKNTEPSGNGLRLAAGL